VGGSGGFGGGGNLPKVNLSSACLESGGRSKQCIISTSIRDSAVHSSHLRGEGGEKLRNRPLAQESQN